MEESLGSRLKKLRTDLDLGLTEAAEKAGTTKQNLYKYEKDIVKNIPIDTIVALSLLYGVNPDTILGWDRDENRVYLSADSKDALLIGFRRKHPELYEIAERYAGASSERKQIVRDVLGVSRADDKS